MPNMKTKMNHNLLTQTIEKSKLMENMRNSEIDHQSH